MLAHIFTLYINKALQGLLNNSAYFPIQSTLKIFIKCYNSCQLFVYWSVTGTNFEICVIFANYDSCMHTTVQMIYMF